MSEVVIQKKDDIVMRLIHYFMKLVNRALKKVLLFREFTGRFGAN